MSREAKETTFHFGESDIAIRTEDAVVRLPPGISTTSELLDKLYVGLSFPDYFGDNWDALWECICDLSWLDPVQVVVMHEDVPLWQDVAELRTYLSIMNDAVEYWADRPEHELVIIFPAGAKALVRSLVHSPRAF